MGGPDLRHISGIKLIKFSEKLFWVTAEEGKGVYIDF